MVDSATPSNNIPLENLEVGHAGLYVPDKNDTLEQAHEKIVNALGTITDTITPDIELGIAKGAKTLIDCETGIKAFVKDELAKPTDNGLPNSETGVWIHYLTLGIERDFGRSWEKDPKALNGREYNYKKTEVDKKHEQGKRLLTKKQKNELIAKRRWDYWEKLIDKNEITEEDAMIGMKQAIDEIKELKDKGLYINPNKTKGVGRFDWEKEITEKWKGDETKLEIYKRNKLLPIIPNLEERGNDKYGKHSNFIKKEMNKSILKIGDYENFDKKFLESKIEELGKMKENYTPTTFSICKFEKAGQMKERWFVIDALRNSDNKQVLLMWDANNANGLVE